MLIVVGRPVPGRQSAGSLCCWHIRPAAGYPFAFDLPGMGDSPAMPFENTAPHIAAALDAWRRRRQLFWHALGPVRRASANTTCRRGPAWRAWRFAQPWVRSKLGLAGRMSNITTASAYCKPTSGANWLAGVWAGAALRSMLRANLRAMRSDSLALLSFQELMALCWKAFEGKIMLFWANGILPPGVH